MNKQRMLELAEELERPHRLLVKFDMSDFIETYPNPYTDEVSDELKSDCGTSACIGGHACLMFGKKGDHIGEGTAKALLGLTQDQTNRLFYNTDKYIAKFTDFEDINREQAANAIRRMVAEEGEQK